MNSQSCSLIHADTYSHNDIHTRQQHEIGSTVPARVHSDISCAHSHAKVCLLHWSVLITLDMFDLHTWSNNAVTFTFTLASDRQAVI